MTCLCQILAIAFIAFSDASVLINILDNGVSSHNLPDRSSELDPTTTNNIDGCNPVACNLSCHILGFHDSMCRNDICECIYSLKQYDMSKLPQISDCSPLGCDQLCRRIGFPGGACVNGRCKCDII